MAVHQERRSRAGEPVRRGQAGRVFQRVIRREARPGDDDLVAFAARAQRERELEAERLHLLRVDARAEHAVSEGDSTEVGFDVRHTIGAVQSLGRCEREVRRLG